MKYNRKMAFYRTIILHFICWIIIMVLVNEIYKTILATFKEVFAFKGILATLNQIACCLGIVLCYTFVIDQLLPYVFPRRSGTRAANVRPYNNFIEIYADIKRSWCWRAKTIYVETMHISCQSDKYDKDQMYMGIVVYKCKGKTDWTTANGTHCKPGYLVILNSQSEEMRKIKGKTRHAAAYKIAFGEFPDESVIAEGFSVQKGEAVFNSGTFNASDDVYHDENNRSMAVITEHCVKKVIKSWKTSHFGTINFSVKDLLADYKNPNFVLLH